MEFMYTDFATPIDFMNYYSVAEEIERKKQEEIENSKREQYK